jgi:diadenosine tetraphosphate (Ap4A) HIT family hydrolase
VNAFSSVVVIPDSSPVTKGHRLIVPVRHVVDFFDMNEHELRDAHVTLHALRRELQKSDPKIAGFNVGVNCGEVAGQTVFHAHIHLIPRRFGDTPSPRGGVRGVIPERMGY